MAKKVPNYDFFFFLGGQGKNIFLFYSVMFFFGPPFDLFQSLEKHFQLLIVSALHC